MSRRHLLRGTAALALGAAAIPLLNACDTATQGNIAVANSKVRLPTYVPYTGVTPDLPAGPDLLPGYFSFPNNLPTTVHQPPGRGAGAVNILVDSFAPVPPALANNRYWQALNQRVGADLMFNMVPDSDYSTKVTTTLAGGDLPDIVMIPSYQPRLPAALKALFQDLTPFLSGDAVKNYPFLANIPDFHWQPMVFDAGIYGLPTPRASIGSIMFTRDDLIAARSLNGQPANYQEFLELCQGLTDANRGHWALNSPARALPFALEIAGAANNWQETNGKFTNAVETDAYPVALDIISSMVKKGLFHPDGFGSTFQQQRDWFGTGVVGLTFDGNVAWNIFRATYPGINVGGLIAPAYHGGKGRHFTGSGSFAVTAIKKGSASRTRQLLEICNYLAAPFGTAEYAFRKYGAAEVDYTMVNGAPVATPAGRTEVAIPLQYVVDSPPVLGPGPRDVITKQYAFHKRVAPLLVRDPTVGLYSTTNDIKGAQLGKILTDAQTEILHGNQPVSAWADAVRNWRASGGDAVSREFGEAFAQVG